jgi:ABC-type methionine transport system ATPase subunit
MSKRQLKLSFSSELVTKPMIYDLNRDYGVTANIQRAGFTDNRGWVLLELDGSDDDIEKGLEWMTSSGVVVEPVTAGVP